MCRPCPTTSGSGSSGTASRPSVRPPRRSPQRCSGPRGGHPDFRPRGEEAAPPRRPGRRRGPVGAARSVGGAGLAGPRPAGPVAPGRACRGDGRRDRAGAGRLVPAVHRRGDSGGRARRHRAPAVRGGAGAAAHGDLRAVRAHHPVRHGDPDRLTGRPAEGPLADRPAGATAALSRPAPSGRPPSPPPGPGAGARGPGRTRRRSCTRPPCPTGGPRTRRSGWSP